MASKKAVYAYTRALKEGVRFSSQRKRRLNLIYKRDNATCVFCDEYVARKDASVEHLIHVSDSTVAEARSFDNMALAHVTCNQWSNEIGWKYKQWLRKRLSITKAYMDWVDFESL